MKNSIPLIITLLILLPAIFLGKKRVAYIQSHALVPIPVEETIPDIGSVEILNGCGKSKVAGNLSGYLRKNRFDVKSTGNAQSFNYKKTLVISRIPDMSIAEKVTSLLRCDDPIFIRTNHSSYDVTVIIGHDYGELRNE